MAEPGFKPRVSSVHPSIAFPSYLLSRCALCTFFVRALCWPQSRDAKEGEMGPVDSTRNTHTHTLTLWAYLKIRDFFCHIILHLISGQGLLQHRTPPPSHSGSSFQIALQQLQSTQTVRSPVKAAVVVAPSQNLRAVSSSA